MEVKPGVKKPADPEAGQTFSNTLLVEWFASVRFIPEMLSFYLDPSVAPWRGFGAMNL